MKEYILEICINYKKGAMNPQEAMDHISNALIEPNSIEVSDHKLRELIALSFDIDPEELAGGSKGRNIEVLFPKYMYRKLISEREYDKKVILRKAGLKNVGSLRHSLIAHDRLIETNSRYRRIYQAIDTILTEAL